MMPPYLGLPSATVVVGAVVVVPGWVAVGVVVVTAVVVVVVVVVSVPHEARSILSEMRRQEKGMISFLIL
jgi:hypothetical protein